MNFDSPYIISAGIVTNLGLNVASTIAAINAELDNFQDTFFKSEFNDPIIGAQITDIEEDDKNHQNVKASTWLNLAIDEALSYFDINQFDECCIALLSPNKLQPNVINFESIIEEALTHIEIKHKFNKDIFSLKVELGKVGCSEAITASKVWLSEKKNRLVILAGVDSWLTAARIEHGLNKNRILCNEKSEGFLPGEAASVVCISSLPLDNNQANLEITNQNMFEETNSLYSEKPSDGIGLANATKNVLKSSGIVLNEVDLTLNDLNGETYFFEEYAISRARVLRKSMLSHHQTFSSAKFLGDIGLATGPFLLAYTWALHQTNKHPGIHSLIQLTSEHKYRSAITLKLNT